MPVCKTVRAAMDILQKLLKLVDHITSYEVDALQEILINVEVREERNGKTSIE